MFKYEMQCKLSHQVWENRGGGWDKDEDNDLPIAMDRSVFAANVNRAIATLCDFGECVAKYSGVPSVIGGSIDVSARSEVRIAVLTSMVLSESQLEDLKDDIAGQLSDGWGENLDSHEIHKWSGRSRDYYISVAFDVDEITKPVLTGEIKPEAGPALASAFFNDLTSSFETLSGIAEEYGPEVLADLFYLQHALLTGNGYAGRITLPKDSVTLSIIRQLNGGNDYMHFVDIEAPAHKVKP